MTKVKFYIEKDNDVFAFFPEDIHSYHPLMYTSYSHIGQHCACALEYANECRKAKESEYLPLKQELESIGYTLKVCK